MATAVGFRGRGDGGWKLSAKVVLLSTAVLSTAVMLRFSVPWVLVFACSQAPRIYAALVLWLTPPYLYLLINGIIISIAASSRFQKAAADGGGACFVAPSAAPAKVALQIRQEYLTLVYEAAEEVKAAVVAEEAEEEEVPVGYRALAVYAPAECGGAEATEEKAVMAKEKEEEEEDFVISRSSWTPRRRLSREVSGDYSDPAAAEKPLVSVRFVGRKSVKASPDGKALGVARPRRNETLENTWRTITDGRPMPLTRHLKKLDTWDVYGDAPAAAAPVRKAETFKERRVTAASPSSAVSGGGSGRLRRETSLGQDELNRRVEAFIKKFNEEMRLQRQESFNHYLEMINRGT